MRDRDHGTAFLAATTLELEPVDRPVDNEYVSLRSSALDRSLKEIANRYGSATGILARPGSLATAPGETLDDTISIHPDESITISIGASVVPTVEAREPHTPQTQTRLERAVDVAVAIGIGMALAPVWMTVAAVSKFTDSGPVLFGHERLGLNGRVFRCWKFRTMRTDADEALRKLLASDPVAAEEWARDHKLSDDPRVTRLGKFLRRFDLDEIPQLINVLNGDMSVVGPRPIVHDEADRFGDRLPVVLSVKPGLTGLWQVSGRNCMSYDDRVVTEAEYASTRTLAGDLRIIVKTPLVLTRSNFGR